MSDNIQWRMPARMQRSATEGDGDANRRSTLPARSQGALRSFSSGHGLGQISEVDSLSSEMRPAALAERHYTPEQLLGPSSNFRPPALTPRLPRPDYGPHIRTSSAGLSSNPSFQSTPNEHGLNEDVNSLGLQMRSTSLRYGYNDPGQLSGTSSIPRPDGPHYQPTFPNPSPRPSTRSMTSAPYLAPSYTHSAPYPFPSAVPFPQPIRSGTTDAEVGRSFEGPISLSPNDLNPVNTYGHSGRNAHQNLTNTHQQLPNTHQIPTNTQQVHTRPYQHHERQPVPIQPSHSMPMPTGTRRESGIFVFGAPMEQGQPAFDGSGFSIVQRQRNPAPEYPQPNHPRYPTVETYVPAPRQQAHQIMKGAHHTHTRGVPANQGPQGESGAYVLQSAYNQETGPLQSSPESLHFPQDTEPVSDLADHHALKHTQGNEQATGLVYESPQSSRNQLNDPDATKPEINEEAFGSSEKGMFCSYLLTQLLVLYLQISVQRNVYSTLLPVSLLIRS